MARELDAVHQRVAEHHIGMCHVYLGTEHLGAFGILAGLHFTEESEILLGGAVAVGTRRTGSVHGAAVETDFLLGFVVDVCQAAFDHILGPLI